MQQISGDPLQRKTVAQLEGDWHDEMNNNLVKTAGQANDLWAVVLGDASESTLNGYSADSVKKRLSDLEAAVSDNDSDITTINNESTIDEDTLVDALDPLVVGIAAASEKSNINLQSGSQMPLKGGDELIINDLTNDTVQQVTVSVGRSEGSTSIPLTASPSSDVSSDAVVSLYPADMRSALDAGQIKNVLWGNNDPANIGTDHESRLQNLNSRVDSVKDRIRSVETLAANSQDKARQVEGTVTSVKTTAEAAALEASKLQVTDTKLLELTSAVDGSVSSLGA